MTAAAAGWYHDPSDSGSWRWWDGEAWTSHVRPKEQTSPIAIAYPVSEAITLPAQYTAPVQAVLAPQVVTGLQQVTVPEPVAVPQAVTSPQPVTVPQPVTAPQPAAAPEIPQPAQPIQPIQPVSLTPETPASEQEYWHSPGAEVVHIPGRSATSQHGHASRVGPVAPYALQHTWGDVGSPQTAGIWLLAFLPLIAYTLLNVMGFALRSLIAPNGAVVDPAGFTQTILTAAIAYIVILVVSAWIFAGRDIKMLRTRGYRAPSIWWMLVPLSPLAYFIARGKVVRAEGKRAWPPELLFFLSIVLPFVLSVLGAIFAMSILAGLAGAAGVPL